MYIYQFNENKGKLAFSPWTTTLSPFTPMNYQFYITPSMNYHFVTNDSLPLVKDVKYDGQHVTCMNTTVNSVVDWRNSVVNSTIDRLI